ncbi:unnamed protein product [Phytophthora lilii]|uniref:Unnamed protein product n=1 Tax=Phytophthora lilii TaxID=2077276 RepID=A0A9W6WSG6_9STRA|nr:unnamed protein product [Phytophthora lilii]
MLVAYFVSAVALLAVLVPSVDAHAYMLIPAVQFNGLASDAWIVQIEPVWKSDKWYGNTAASVDAFKALKTANNFKDLKTLMSASMYGADCGFTNPNGTPQPIPTDGKATLSRILEHGGPCEIWLDNNKMMYRDDCNGMSSFPINYSFVTMVDAKRCDSTGGHFKE